MEGGREARGNRKYDGSLPWEISRLTVIPLGITTQDVEAHIKQFLAETNSDILVVGNMTKEVDSPIALGCAD
jgi:hypothetical protein